MTDGQWAGVVPAAGSWRPDIEDGRKRWASSRLVLGEKTARTRMDALMVMSRWLGSSVRQRY
ncbi:MAG: hypothetical protein AB7V43_20825, partial [Acidimicrobiia bacterium]